VKFELKSFQEEKRRELQNKLSAARDEFSKSGELQAIVLSSPTGSGKTITIGALLESLFEGDDDYPAQPEARVLWISDSPELNIQSRDKLLKACDTPDYDHLEVISSETFDEEFLRAGVVYFINTQLLGKDKLLTQEGGDRRRFTFWQTIANTVRDYGNDFLLVIDEAHRGMGLSARERQARTTTIQKFIKGSSEYGLPPVPLILGMSATTQRFDTVLGETQRTVRKTTISPEEVRSSGLLKDQMVVVVPAAEVNTDMTLLETAVRRWRDFENTWDEYTRKEGERHVRPVFVIQVQDGIPERNILSRTPLDEVVEVLRRELRQIKQGALVHCFDAPGDISFGGENIRRIDASRIQDDDSARIVLFKTALSTGWDCPRAEVMMSFRKAVDKTSIAQLIGRMIRTPLARRIDSYEMLNAVELYLPHYDRNSLEAILTELRNPEAEDRVPTEVTTVTQVSYARNPELSDVFTTLERIKIASFSNPCRLLPVRRLMRLAWLLTDDDIDAKAYERERADLVSILIKHREQRWKDDQDWASLVRETGQVELEQFIIGLGKMEMPTAAVKVRAELASENIEGLFREAHRRIGPGTDIHAAFRATAEKKTEPALAKLELFALSGDPGVLKEINDHAETRFATLEAEHRGSIRRTKAKRKERYRKLQQAGRDPLYVEWDLPEQVSEKEEGEVYEQHLFCDGDGKFQTKLNTWETAVLKKWMTRDDFAGWLRNPPRKPWSFCVAYEHGGTKGFHPDLLLFRRSADRLVVDVVEPHRTNQDDTYAKAKGLAEYAEAYGGDFGQLMMVKVEGSGDNPLLFGFDVNERETRKKSLALRSNEDVQGLFRPL